MADLDHYARHLQNFRASDEARERLVGELIQKYSSLLEEHANLKNDYLSERDIRRNYQTTVEEKRIIVGGYERQLEASSFVLALIDGDGAIFQDALLHAAGGDGGSEAASRLYHTIQDHIASLYSNSGSWPIIVQIYLSLDKLAQKLAQVGLLRSPQELRQFAQRFSVNQPLFSIIDVGQGKERADHKIKEMLRTFSDNPTCRHIVFGGCHDAGYLLNLDQFKHNEHKAGQITLLETTPAYRGFVDLPNFKRARFDSVFRTGPLPEPTQASTFAPQAPSSAPQAPTQPPPVLRSMTNKSSPTASPKPSTSSLSPSTAASSITGPPTEASGDSSWATIGKTGSIPNENISIAPNTAAPTTNSKKKYAYYNKAEQRLDEPLPPKDQGATYSLENRMQKSGKKMCNHWHLGNKCDNGKFCKFQHEPKLTPAELNALRYKTRSLACKNRYCEKIDCYLGHQCAVERDQGYCPFENCHLRATHGMDKVKFVKVDREGNEVYE
ncbi:hypothetical protein P153DRAFT_292341 [Dothidotthia symphoricarpi CBS 119687]|uniref:C3H1-type domain-containing protein n=1 Tax=Dothidotthia symphoricarpi CBS 119687 TaxID=1392245 RepID=A0A6A6AC42_9PLEO|nr:uncharacterized protein P153DRAFT_292341 [Dothidotthia symphoricarpi CBS 119687]KAF2128803.1 hypothetical protein P153DRAFT_292341 [Dothidotthia symphoricarpi CBS 119687]